MGSTITSLEKRLTYQFKDQSLLELALRHRSHSGSQNNERLEFLGDSILNFVIGYALFDKFPEAREGQLSRLRASLVKGSTLTKLAQDLALGEHLLLGPGEMKSGGSRRNSILADAVEAIIGAVYLDAGMERCQSMILSWYASRMEKLDIDDTVKDNKTRLQEWLQSQKLPLPDYRIVDVSGKSHSQSFVVECEISNLNLTSQGEGQSRRQAEQVAAGKLILQIEQGC